MHPTWAQLVLFGVGLVLMSISNVLLRTARSPRSSGVAMTRKRVLDQYAIAPIGAVLAVVAALQHSWLFTAVGVFLCVFGIIAPRSQVRRTNSRDQFGAS